MESSSGSCSRGCAPHSPDQPDPMAVPKDYPARALDPSLSSASCRGAPILVCVTAWKQQRIRRAGTETRFGCLAQHRAPGAAILFDGDLHAHVGASASRRSAVVRIGPQPPRCGSLPYSISRYDVELARDIRGAPSGPGFRYSSKCARMRLYKCCRTSGPAMECVLRG